MNSLSAREEIKKKKKQEPSRNLAWLLMDTCTECIAGFGNNGPWLFIQESFKDSESTLVSCVLMGCFCLVSLWAPHRTEHTAWACTNLRILWEFLEWYTQGRYSEKVRKGAAMSCKVVGREETHVLHLTRGMGPCSTLAEGNYKPTAPALVHMDFWLFLEDAAIICPSRC